MVSFSSKIKIYTLCNPGAVHAKHVVVMAQLIVKGKNEGIHAILVRMRDNDLKTIPGVTIEDMGYKMGLNGVDNAKLSFDNVRVPRTALLNRWNSNPKNLLFKHLKF